MINVDFSRSDDETVPQGHSTIEELIAQAEQDEATRKELASARKWVGKTFYTDEPNSLRALRLKRGLSQARLAAMAKTTQSHIARIENGSTDCQIGTLERIASALNVDAMVAIAAFRNARAEANA